MTATDREPLYKWMIEDFTSPIQNTQWPVEAGEWTPEVSPILCKSGYHGWHEKDAMEWLPQTTRSCTLWTVETRGQVIEGDDKFVAASMRLVYKVGTTNERNLRIFAADCAEDVLPFFLAIRPDDDRPAKAIEAARLFAGGQIDAAARAAAWAAARTAAGDAAWAKYSNWLVVRVESDY